MTLNGWQRLWVLVSVFWLVPVLFLAYQWWPTADKYIEFAALAQKYGGTI